MFSVEIRFAEGELAERMNQMRTWLDEERYTPNRFHLFGTQGQVRIYHVSFETQAEAIAFAKEFKGHVL